MAFAAAGEFLNNNLGAPPPAPDHPRLHPVRDPLPEVPRWNMEHIHQPTPRELQEEQMEFLTQIWTKEVHNHNTTRARLQQYLTLYLKHERGLCSEYAHVQYLNTVIHDLRTQIQEEKMKRMAAEEAQSLHNCLDYFSCVRTLAINHDGPYS